ncbi:MAG: dihydroxy-acid dehydratase [Acidobacteria bacterium]|nr:dihydroxy-acid dehydratase [Acidobacteriota bacterium]MCW5967323.1 dihydroxy-acid dehydratase [Blastocatellales bacterium]
MGAEVRILRGDNPYKREVQGKANEPITVAALLDRARALIGAKDLSYSLTEIYDRLECNAPRIAIIGGSPDHPAHILDLETTLRAAARIWQCGGVPFSFSTPVLCDGTAQSHTGMCYSLESRNAIAQMVVNQMEAQAYHGAFVIQGCDKQPLAVVGALAALDRTRRRRGDAPVFATFAPAHVLKGGTIPPDLREEIEAFAAEATRSGHSEIADDLSDALAYVLQCSSNTQFQGVFQRAVNAGLLAHEIRKDFEKRLAVNTCDGKGGICAFNGTGNSSRHVVSALGLVHPALELLTEPPDQARVNAAVDAMFTYCNDPQFSVSEMVRRNIENAVRIHSTTGGSTNLMMHLVAAAIYAGLDFSIHDYDRIRRHTPVPDLFDYSLTAGRTIFELASQCCSGQIRGMETVTYELGRNGVPMQLDAPTATGTSWETRLSDTRNLAANGVTDNPIILARPRRRISGVDVLAGNFFETAVVKISGMPEAQLDEFDGKVSVVVYFENEDEANAELLDVNLHRKLAENTDLNVDELLAIYGCNSGKPADSGLAALSRDELFERMLGDEILKFTVVISGQGPEAFGMPEMFTPMQHINANRHLKRLAMIVTDGRYSGVSYGAAIGHVTPEAMRGGGILYLRTGDLVQANLRARNFILIDRGVLVDNGEKVPYQGDLTVERKSLGEMRLKRIQKRRRIISPTNRMSEVTDASQGVVPRAVVEDNLADADDGVND